MLDLDLLPGDYAICRLPSGSALPPSLQHPTGVVSITWTPEEVSIICPVEKVPPEASAESPWRCFRASQVTLTMTGMLSSLTGPLAEARVNIVAFSTYESDYVLVPAVRLAEARAALGAAGHRVSG